MLVLAVGIVVARQMLEVPEGPVRPADRLLAQLGHGNSLAFVGRRTIHKSNPAFDAVVTSADPAETDRLVAALAGGRLDVGQVGVIDHALWMRATGLPKERIAVLGSWERPIGPADPAASAAAWTAWANAGRPTVTVDGDGVRPDLHGYPSVGRVVRSADGR